VPGPERFAVLFCAYNEERSAEDKVANLTKLKQRYPGLRIHIYDDGSTDRTREIYAALGPDVVQNGEGRVGKATGMRRLVASVDREFLLFTDANVMLDERIIDRCAPYFADPTVGGVCGHLEYVADENTSTQAAGGAYWRLEEMIKRLESRTGSVMGGDGSIFVIRRELYPVVPPTAQDDFTATMSVVFSGNRLVVGTDVVARERLVAKSGDEYRRKVRISARAVHTHMAMRDRVIRMSRLNRWKYFSHKVVRWFGIFFLSGAITTALAGLAFLEPVWALWALAALVMSAACVWLVPGLAPLKEVLLAVAATGQGVTLALRGKTFATWVPPQSR